MAAVYHRYGPPGMRKDDVLLLGAHRYVGTQQKVGNVVIAIG